MNPAEAFRSKTQRSSEDYTPPATACSVLVQAERGCVFGALKDIKVDEPDSTWAWFICALGLTSSVIILGLVFSFGVLNPVFIEEFHEGKARTAWLGSLCMSCASFFGPLSAKLCDRFGSRAVSISGALTCITSLLASSQVPRLWMLYITYSCLFGFGASCIHTAIFLVVSASFLKRRSLATGTLVAGHAAGIMIVSPLLQALLSRLGWRRTFLVWAGVVSPICVFGCVFKSNVQNELRNEEGISKREGRGSDSQTFSIWRHPPFLVYATSTAVLYLGHHILQLHMASYCKDLGIEAVDAARLYLGFGIASVIARLLIGKLCDSNTLYAQHVFQTAGFVMGAATLLCPLSSNSYILLMVYFVTFGFAEGSSATAINYLILTCVPDHARSKSFGFWQFFVSLTMAIGPPFAGFIADELGSYVPAFYIAGSIIIISSLVVFALRCFKEEDGLISVNEKIEELFVVEKDTVL